MKDNKITKIFIDDLCLKCLETKDAKQLKEAIDSSLDHLRTFMDFAHKEPLPLAHKIEKIKTYRKKFQENKDYNYGIFRENDFLGKCGLHKRLEGNALEIGYWVKASEINKGIATKIVIALLKIAFEFIEVNRVEIHIYKKNKASGRIPEKLGFKKMLDYTFIEKNDSSWFVMNKKIYFSKKKSFEFFYSLLKV